MPTDAKGDVSITADFVASHKFSYTASGATITAKCVGNDTDCDYKTDGISLTISAPANLDWDGSAKKATLSSGYPNPAPDDLAAAPTSISYAKVVDGQNTAIDGAPTAVGNYVASFTWGGQTASVSFAIAAPPADVCGDGLKWAYDDSSKKLTISYTSSGSGRMYNYSTEDRPPWYNNRDDIETVVIAQEATTISSYAFSGCSRLSTVTIPKNVTDISDNCFSGCADLASVTISGTLTSDVSNAFQNCTKLERIYCNEDTWKKIKAKSNNLSGTPLESNPYFVNVIANPADGGTVTGGGAYAKKSPALSATVTATPADDYVFTYWMDSADTVVKDADGKYAGAEYTFTPIKDVTLYANFGTLSGSCGNNGDNLTWAMTDEDNDGIYETLTISGSGDMKNYGFDWLINAYNMPWLPHTYNIQAVKIWKDVTSIGDNAFFHFENLSSLTFGDGSQLKTIGNSAFDKCLGLTSLTLPDNVTTIKGYAFNQCGFTSVTLGEKVQTIGIQAFIKCKSLTSVNIPESVTNLERVAFDQCEKLTYIDCTKSKWDNMISKQIGNVEGVNKNSFSNTPFELKGGGYYVSVSVPDGHGTVKGVGAYAKETQATLTGIPDKGYPFAYWKDANDNVIKDAEGKRVGAKYTFTPTEDVSLTASFHPHSFTYSASGDTITAACDETDCHLTNNEITLTIKAPLHTTYGDGEAATAILDGLEDFNTETELSVSEDSIKYYEATKSDDAYTRGKELDAAPAGVGDYVAEITISGVKTSAGEGNSVTASLGYTIAKADPGTPTVTMEGYTFGGTVSTPGVSDNPGSAEVTYYYNTTDSASDGAEWKDITATTLDAGAYYMYAGIAESDNYNGYTTGTQSFTISQAAAPAIPNVTVSPVYTLTSVSESVSGKMPTNAGTLTYAAGDASTTGSVTVSNFSVSTDGIVTATLSSGAEGDTVTLPVTISSTNYADATVNVVLTLTEKGEAGLSISGAPTEDKTYGDAEFTLEASVTAPGTDGTGVWTWSTSDSEVFQITQDAQDGAKATVEIKKAGSAWITVEYESDTTLGSEDTDLITVKQASLTIAAKDQSIYVGGTVPDLSDPVKDTHFTVTGLVGQDALTANPTLTYESNGSAVTPDNTTAGATYDITPSGASVGDNYTIEEYKKGTLTIMAKNVQTITASDVAVTYGDTDKKVSATADGGGAISYAVKDGSGNYIEVASDGKLTIKGVPEDNKAYVVVTAAETDSYAKATKEVTVTINKANSVAATVTPNNRNEDGTEQPLVTVDNSTLVGGKMYYALGADAINEPTGDWSQEIPQKTEAGTYYVWYMVKGDSNHNNTAAKCATVSIIGPDSAVVTFKVVGGKWDDGTTADKTVTLTCYKGETMKLAEKDIPAVGAKPDDTFKAGSWDTAPSADTVFADGSITTYTYSYAKKTAISATVTFKVVNGKWNDGTAEDVTVTLSGYEGDALKLAEKDIPAVGNKPDDTFKAGSWDAEPSASTAFAGGSSTTYTYSYAKKTAISAKVTFKVVNGAWDEGEGEAATADRTVTLSGYEGDTLKLAETDIPAAGNKPDNNFKAGSWDTEPGAGTVFADGSSTTYTYTYAQKAAISATVTFKVVNGSWDDETIEDVTVTLSGYEGDTLKLTAEQIPAAGNKPARKYKAGGWDVTPDAETAITGDATYTYTYAKKAAISAKVTFKVVNGSWDDGTAKDKTATLTGYEGDTLRLSAKQIPAVGNEPAKHYKAGSWDVKPNTKRAITEDTTYTYTYAEKDAISVKVTFKVVNGSWDDGKTKDKTVTLTGNAGDALKLSAKQIPAVGSKPAKHYKAGVWDVTPSTDMAIAQDTTYTYTYLEEDAITAAVTFKVVNGAWDDGNTAAVTVSLTGRKGDTLKLSAKQIPAVGNEPAKHYKAGSWDVKPNTKRAITGDTTYTYTYAPKDAISAKVTFKVVNGAWDDGKTKDKTVTLTGKKGDTLKLSAKQIPSAGSKPAENYKAGVWDVTPSTDTAITKDTTYTYTYLEEDAITAAVTFKVVNGAWDDGNTAAVTVTLTGKKGDKLKLTAKQIPAAGNKPAKNYKAGSWDVTPNTKRAITGDTTYTYTYAKKDAISAKVTFKVVNGSWDDGKTKAVTVTLTGYEGDKLKLSAKQIPAAGSKPAEHYKAGVWDVTPSTDTAIRKDTTYTYTYLEEDAISAAVTFKVVNGAWDDGNTADVTVSLTGRKGDTLKLAAKQIPAVGNEPARKYKAGSWDVTPDTETAITENTTYTYTYAKKAQATVVEAPAAIKPTYNGKSLKLVTAGKAEGGTMVYAVAKGKKTPKASAYTESIPKEINAGVYYVWYKVVGDGDHLDTEPAKVRAKIRRLNINKLEITIKDLNYTGKRQRPNVTIKYGKKTLVRKKDYILFFDLKNRRPGDYEVTAKGKGNYTGVKELKYKVVIPDITIEKLVGDKLSITVMWSEKLKMDGYQIQYSKSEDMSVKKTETFKNTDISQPGTQTIIGLNDDTRYYVRMRGYKRIDKKKYFTNWSAVESVKTKPGTWRNEAARQVGMNVGETLDLKAMLAEGEAAADWITNEKDIIAVTGDGFVTAMQAGHAAVIAILENGEEIEFAISVSEDGVVLLDLGENDLTLDLDEDVLGDVFGDVETNLEIEN